MKNLIKYFFVAISFALVSNSVFAKVVGSIKSTPNCGTDFEVFVSKEKTLLYQFTVPAEGTFEVHLKPDDYQIFAMNEKKCQTKIDVKVSSLTDKQTLELKPKTLKENRSPATGISLPGDYARMGSPYNPWAGYSWGYPWWGGWSSPYANFNYPGAWGNYGIRGVSYPYHGGFAAGKPNIYFEGVDQNLTVSLGSEKYSILAAVPALDDKRGWDIQWHQNEVRQKKMAAQYLFYDARLDGESFQQDTGFCGTREDVLSQMIDSLKVKRFPEKAMKDFAQYWVIKLPQIGRFCVYPQENKELEKQMPVSVQANGTDLTYDLNRVLFVVVPQNEALKKASVQQFKTAPKTKWTPAPVLELAKKSTRVHEWGVAFFAE